MRLWIKGFFFWSTEPHQAWPIAYIVPGAKLPGPTLSPKLLYMYVRMYVCMYM